MTSIEKTGKNVEEATQLALEELGVTEDEVDVEILDEGSRGFLGLGQTPAAVRVTPRDTATGKKVQKPTAEKAPAPAPAAPAPQAAPAAEAGPTGSIDDAAEFAQEMLQTVLKGMGDKAKVVIKSADESQIVLDMVGGETAVLVGKHGQTINALQYLISIITNKQVHGQVRVVLDAEGYRTRREDMLRSQVQALAAKVKESGQEAVLDPLQAHERRIVHMALADDPDVETYSEGDEPERYVVISPRK
jgi:spoIIIJ-associated protein